MNENDVIKALECCMKGNNCGGCCPYDDEDDTCEECTSKLAKDALDLIKRQWAEIERLKEIANPKCQQCVEQTRKNSIIELANELKHRMLYWSYDFQYNSEYIAADREIDDLVKEKTEVKDDEKN